MVSEDGSEATAFDRYVEALIEVIGHAIGPSRFGIIVQV